MIKNRAFFTFSLLSCCLVILSGCPGYGDRAFTDEEAVVSVIGNNICFWVNDSEKYQPSIITVPDEVRDWLPGGQLYHDFLALMHVYLGARVNARLQLRIPRSALPDAQLTSNKCEPAVQLGRTAVLRLDNPEANNQFITIKLGLWQSLSQHDQRREADETGDYRY